MNKFLKQFQIFAIYPLKSIEKVAIYLNRVKKTGESRRNIELKKKKFVPTNEKKVLYNNEENGSWQLNL